MKTWNEASASGYRLRELKRNSKVVYWHHTPNTFCVTRLLKSTEPMAMYNWVEKVAGPRAFASPQNRSRRNYRAASNTSFVQLFSSILRNRRRRFAIRKGATKTNH